MFDDIERMLGGLENTIRIPISIPLDDDGNLDRLCPHPQCRHAFKVLFDDWEAKVSNEKAFCPLCRHDAEPTDFNTPELDEFIGEVSLAHAAGLIDDTMSRMAQAFNATQSRNDFISVKMSYEPGGRPVLMPPEAAEQMRQKFECDNARAITLQSALLSFARLVATIHRGQLLTKLSLWFVRCSHQLTTLQQR